MRISVIGDASSPHVLGRARAFTRRGHQVTVLSEQPGTPTDLEILSPARYGTRGLATVRQLGRFARLMRAAAADVYHVHYATGYGAWLSAAIGLRPLVVSVMGGDVLPDEQAPQGVLARWLTRRLLLDADLVTSKSRYLNQRLLAMGVSPDRIMPLLWGVDVETFRPGDDHALRRRLDIPADATVVLSPRSVTQFYNIHLILEGFAKALRDHPQAVLVIVGHRADVDYQAELDRRATELGITDRVRFVGSVPAEEMPAYFGMAAVAVNMPPSDGMPQSIMEAMACGTPNLVGALERYEELIQHGESAWFTEPAPEKIGGAMSRLLADPGLRQRLAAAGLAIVRERANLTEQVARLEEAFRSLAAGGRPTPRRHLHPGMLVAIGLVVLTLGLRRWLGQGAPAARSPGF